MFPAIAIIALLATLNAPTHVANQDFEVPDERLLPAMGGALYIGDDFECTAERQDVWRYGDDKALYLCSDKQWRRIDVTGGDK
jgi:hypothetical protein